MLPRLVQGFHILHCFGIYIFFPPLFATSPLPFFSQPNTQSLAVSSPPLFLQHFFFSLRPVPSHLSYWSVTCDDVLRFWGISLALSACARQCVRQFQCAAGGLFSRVLAGVAGPPLFAIDRVCVWLDVGICVIKGEESCGNSRKVRIIPDRCQAVFSSQVLRIVLFMQVCKS